MSHYLLYILIIALPLLAQLKITSAYNKYKQVKNSRSISGFEVARKILDANGLENIYVVEVAGNLTDHYDPTRKTIRLSKDIFHGETIAASSVAAHECGHAIQDKESYFPMRLRSMLVPFVNLTSKISWIVIMIGIITSMLKIFWLGIGLISFTLIFQLVTLPVEFDASNRAKKELIRLGIQDENENEGTKKMLSAAAMTYVASVLTSILEILRLMMAFNNNRR